MAEWKEKNSCSGLVVGMLAVAESQQPPRGQGDLWTLGLKATALPL